MHRNFLIFSLLACCTSLLAQQASITLQNSDIAYCYKQDANWTLSKTNDSGYPASVAPGTTVNWKVTATRGANGPTQLCAVGYVTVLNSGTAPATIGNIVVNLQRNTGKWSVISADVADATSGDNAQKANIVAGALQGQTTYPPGVVAQSGQQATFYENSLSGKLEFTDANSNTIWAITPQQTIPVGQKVDLFFTAVFDVHTIAFNPGEQLRTEVFVTFGNAGARGGSGATANYIDVNGNGLLDSDEANVRTVPTRVTKLLPPLQICNDTVTITDTFATTDTATVSLSVDPIGTGVMTSSSSTYGLTGIVDGEGIVTNTARLAGSDSTVALTLGTDPVTLQPITTDMPCCRAVSITASSTVLVVVPPKPANYCSYTQGGFQGGGVPGSLLLANFATSFPSGLMIGTTPNYNALWTDVTRLRTYLAGGGPSGKFTKNDLNPTSTDGGTLARQTAALAINVTLGLGSVFGSPGIGSLHLTGTGTSLDGQTVTAILAVANAALGTGVLPGGYTKFGPLNDLITNLNESWDDCKQSSWAVMHLQ